MINFLSFLQIIHLKRFQFMNGRWVKSQKIVKFPVNEFDPTNYIVPRDPTTITAGTITATTTTTSITSITNTDKLENINGATNHNTPSANQGNKESANNQKADGDTPGPVMNGSAVVIKDHVHSGEIGNDIIIYLCTETQHYCLLTGGAVKIKFGPLWF